MLIYLDHNATMHLPLEVDPRLPCRRREGETRGSSTTTSRRLARLPRRRSSRSLSWLTKSVAKPMVGMGKALTPRKPVCRPTSSGLRSIKSNPDSISLRSACHCSEIEMA